VLGNLAILIFMSILRVTARPLFGMLCGTSMSTETKKRVFICKRADFLSQETRTLQTVLEEALKACPKTGQRVQAISNEGDEVKRVLNEHRHVGAAIGGVLYRYTPGQHQVVVTPNPDASEWPVAQVLPPTSSGKQKAEFVDGLLFFLIFENHVIVSQSAALRTGQLEDYLSNFLRDTAKVTNANEMVILKDVPSEKLRKEGLAKVRSVSFGLALANVVKEPPEKGSRNRKETILHVLNNQRLALVESTLKAFGIDVPAAGLTSDDAEAVEVLIQLRVGGRRIEEANELLDQVGNLFANTPDRDYEVEFEDGAKMKGSELVVRTTSTVESEGGVPKTNSVWKEMARYLKELQESKTVIGQ